MAVLIDISPTSVEFVHNGRIYKISEIMENNDELMITAKEKKPETESVDTMILEEN